MDERLGSLARFAEVHTVRCEDHLIVDMAWYTKDDDALPILVRYDRGNRGGVVRFSPFGDDTNTDIPRACVGLSDKEFLAVLVWLIRRGLLEDVGLVSTETADGGRDSCLCAVEPVGEAEGMDSRVRGNDGVRGGDGIGGNDEEGETKPDAPFPPPFSLREGAGEPDWLDSSLLLEYLHHDLDLSRSDIAKLCDTTPARVKGALKRHGLEQRSQRGGRSKIAPRSDSASTGV